MLALPAETQQKGHSRCQDRCDNQHCFVRLLAIITHETYFLDLIKKKKKKIQTILKQNPQFLFGFRFDLFLPVGQNMSEKASSCKHLKQSQCC